MESREKRIKIKKEICINFEKLVAGLAAGDTAYIQEWLPLLNIILNSQGANKLMVPKTYHINGEFVLVLQCFAMIRADDYGVMKLDLMSWDSRIGEGGVSWVAPIITLQKSRDGASVICKDKINQRVGKATIKTIEIANKTQVQIDAEVNKATTFIDAISKTEVNGLKVIQQGNVRGPYFTKHVGNKIIICGVLTMERMPGVNLGSLRDSGVKFSIKETIETLLQCLYQLQTRYHARDVVHNDLKPENIMMTCVQGQPRARLFDLGFMRSRFDGRYESVMGTFNYMAPEMVEECKFSCESDIYSLGLTFRFMLDDVGFHDMLKIEYLNQLIQARRSGGWDGVVKFPARSDISDSLYTELKSTVLGMTNRDPELRIPLDDCISRIEDIYIKAMLSDVEQKERIKKAESRVPDVMQTEEENVAEEVKFEAALKEKITKTEDAYINATFFSFKSRKYSLLKNGIAEHIAMFKRKLLRNFDDTVNTEDVVQIFCSMQEELCLKGMTSFDAIRAKINSVIDDYMLARTKWEELGTVIRQLENNAELLSEYNIFSNRIDNSPLHLDVLLLQTQHVQRKMIKMHDKVSQSSNGSRLSC